MCDKVKLSHTTHKSQLVIARQKKKERKQLLRPTRSGSAAPFYAAALREQPPLLYNGIINAVRRYSLASWSHGAGLNTFQDSLPSQLELFFRENAHFVRQSSAVEFPYFAEHQRYVFPVEIQDVVIISNFELRGHWNADERGVIQLLENQHWPRKTRTFPITFATDVKTNTTPPDFPLNGSRYIGASRETLLYRAPSVKW